eukprot:207311_1
MSQPFFHLIDLCSPQPNETEDGPQDLQSVVPGCGSIPREHMLSLFSHLDFVSIEFATKFPFESFVPNQNCTKETILNNLNNHIIQILNATTNGLGLDVAFVQINVLLVYVASLITRENNAQFMDYYQFLLHFVICGCCLGTKYVVPSLTTHTADNDRNIFPYFTRKYKKDWPLHLKYTYCGSLRESITDQISRYLSKQYDYYGEYIAMMIADYALLEFEEFFYVISFWTLQPDNREKCGLTSLNMSIGLVHENEYYASHIPKCLLHDSEFNMPHITRSLICIVLM